MLVCEIGHSIVDHRTLREAWESCAIIQWYNVIMTIYYTYVLVYTILCMYPEWSQVSDQYLCWCKNRSLNLALTCWKFLLPSTVWNASQRVQGVDAFAFVCVIIVTIIYPHQHHHFHHHTGHPALFNCVRSDTSSVLLAEAATMLLRRKLSKH